jgi:tRNA-intron endonuclease
MRVRMSKTEALPPETPAIRIKGVFTEKGIRISSKQHADELSQRGYGTAEDSELLLTFHEALYLLDKGVLEVVDRKGRKTDFQNLLQRYRKMNENAWAEYLAYRDLRSRGYVVREGFGSGVDFRVYERGEYSKDTAKYLTLSIQEGKPISLASLTNALKQSQSLKKELVLAVMNRRGEVVYYSVSQLALP